VTPAAPEPVTPEPVTPDGAAGLVSRAEAAVLLSGTDPRVALAEARAVLAETAGEPCAEAVSIALRASALATRELGDLALAEERLLQAITAGEGWPRRVAQARMSLVTIRAQLGDPEGGLRLADLAERDLAGGDLARLGVQRSVALILLGRHGEAVRHCDDAIESLAGDPKFQAGGLLNRGLARTFLEEYGEAEADLSACADLARQAGLDHVAMLAEGNLPFVAARRGDIPSSFERYHAAESALFGYPERLAAMRTDYAEALLAARLPGEARAVVEQAVPDLEAAGAHATATGPPRRPRPHSPSFSARDGPRGRPWRRRSFCVPASSRRSRVTNCWPISSRAPGAWPGPAGPAPPARSGSPPPIWPAAWATSGPRGTSSTCWPDLRPRP